MWFWPPSITSKSSHPGVSLDTYVWHSEHARCLHNCCQACVVTCRVFLTTAEAKLLRQPGLTDIAFLIRVPHIPAQLRNRWNLRITGMCHFNFVMPRIADSTLKSLPPCVTKYENNIRLYESQDNLNCFIFGKEQSLAMPTGWTHAMQRLPSRLPKHTYNLTLFAAFMHTHTLGLSCT